MLVYLWAERAVNRFAAGAQVDVQDPTGNPMCHPIASLQNSLGLQQNPNNFNIQAVNGALMTPRYGAHGIIFYPRQHGIIAQCPASVQRNADNWLSSGMLLLCLQLLQLNRTHSFAYELRALSQLHCSLQGVTS